MPQGNHIAIASDRHVGQAGAPSTALHIYTCPCAYGRQLGGTQGAQQSVDQAYCHCKIPRMELVLNAGKPSNWRSIWPPTK